jgi:hypothetical protein
MPIPNGSGGYQYTSGNPSEVILGVQATVATNIGAGVTLTAAQLASGILPVGASQTTAQTFTLPSASGLDTATNAVVPSARVGSTFELVVVNTGTGATGTAALAMGSGTGFTDGGNATVAISATSSGRFLFRKTADATWTVYRV